MSEILILIIVLVVLAFALVSMSVRIVRPYEKGLVERLGKFQRVLDPGLNLIIPF